MTFSYEKMKYQNLMNSKIIHELPNLNKLDESDVTEEEKKKAKSMVFNNSDVEKFDSFVQENKNPATVNSANANSSQQSRRILKIQPSPQNMASQKESDKPLITAILALLPELSNESLDVVIQKVLDLKK